MIAWSVYVDEKQPAKLYTGKTPSIKTRAGELGLTRREAADLLRTRRFKIVGRTYRGPFFF